jgi:hypothetical protein
MLNHATALSVVRGVGINDVRESKGLALRSVNSCGLFRREDARAGAPKYSLCVRLVQI